MDTQTTLETEINKFAGNLPYWEKFLAVKILAGHSVSDVDIETSYSYLLEDLKLSPPTEKPEITIIHDPKKTGNYKSDIILNKLENVEGVNALAENQVIEFCPKLTIIFGANGSGKSGYVRLLKKVFYSKSPEEIQPNIHLDGQHKLISANFIFNSQNTDIPLNYPENKDNVVFHQFSIFDGKSVFHHLAEKNEFEFRPVGLNFFADYTDIIKIIEQKNLTEIRNKQSENYFEDLFEGDSEIKDLIKKLSAKTELESLKKYTPFTEVDKLEKEKIDKAYDDLLLMSKNKKNEISRLQNIIRLLEENKKITEGLNKNFTDEALFKIKNAIRDCLNKELLAKTEGFEKFKVDGINGIGTTEWKDFIVAADKFAKFQHNSYPQDANDCLLCNQLLSEDAKKLIEGYWKFIKSVAEEDVKKTHEILNKNKLLYERLNFDLFPEENVLSIWLKENQADFLSALKSELKTQNDLATNILLDIASKTPTPRSAIIINIDGYETIVNSVHMAIKNLEENQQIKELDRLQVLKSTLLHKEKLNLHFSKIETFVNNQKWIEVANNVSFSTIKRKITDTEKMLSDTYFNKKYIDAFSKECLELNGNFDIVIDHTGTGGKSYRQLKIKGKNPNMILSEGEQKVIAITDFLVEMELSEINKGIIFDDPVSSLDDTRKIEIAKRLVKEATSKQVIIFTHDLVFVSSLINASQELELNHQCHWIENSEGKNPGVIWLKNTPSYEKEYKSSDKAQKYYTEATNAAPGDKEEKIKNGFAALRTSYEAQVVFGLFGGVVQRFTERVSVDSLKNVNFTAELKDELLDGFHQCCQYMEGHLHSDKYSYKKPELKNLREEIDRFDFIKGKIKAQAKT